ncbi:MAG: DUF3109 family protein [Ignavibacteria bacterium]|jgi:hypothetical protein
MLISVRGTIVRSEIADTPFICDVNKCKGACCTFESKYGAPLRKDEVGKIDKILDEVKPYLSKKHVDAIEQLGFYDKSDDELLISSIEKKDCVFVFYENNIARCAIEKAFEDGKVEFKKPISCHLFPIRVSDFGGDVLRFEKFEECDPAFKKGESENVTVAEFCEEPLERLYGEKWYLDFKKAIGR